VNKVESCIVVEENANRKVDKNFVAKVFGETPA
jgi:hypothetical protein